MVSKTRLLLCASVLLFITTISCADRSTSARAKAKEIWRQHKAVVEAAARREKVDLDAFHAACIFFENLTGIAVPGDASTLVDWYPTEQTRTAIEPLNKWYSENGDRLYWDEESQTVKLLP